MSGLGLDDGTVDVVVLHGGSAVRMHGPARCAGVACPIHRPSRHPLRDAPLSWLPELQLMMRECAHGRRHPDPDSMAYLEARLLAYGSWHECCEHRCCTADGVPPQPVTPAAGSRAADRLPAGGRCRPR